MFQFRFSRGALHVVLLCALIWSGVQPVGAQPIYPLDELLAFAEGANPSLAVARGQQETARAAIDSAAAYPNPELELSSGHYQARVEGVRGGAVEGASLSQPLELPALRGERRRAANSGLDGADAALDGVRIVLRAQVRQAYYEVLRRNEEAAIAEESRQLLEQIRNRVKVKVEVGEAPRYELIKAEAELLNAASAGAAARLRVDEAKAVLRALSGGKLPWRFELAKRVPNLTPPPALETLRQGMLGSHPLLRQARAETARAQARVAQERALGVPQPTLKAGYERDPETRQWRVGVSLPLPLWNQRQGPIGEAVGVLHQAEAAELQQQLALTQELEGAHARLQIALRQQEAVVGGLMKEAQAALLVAEAAYRFGERGILDYLDAQRTLRGVRSDAIQSRYNLLAAAIDIERLSGIELLGVEP